ncbi:hypothetical protein PHLCEN_2v10855 [Hermanssonia centrifuga]|uniref:Fe2OG dioxygenase domain-containing protein n=1 Tax=Hermanssonia centrifuga TaxID=98765 RepID=A0A2R6NLT4_9APHY|nr:hypothetical protein PHLCEN_2v10855 [Hermanssonia centrifuga]
MATNFSSVPMLDYSLVSAASTRAAFVCSLQSALTTTGFFYLTSHPVPAELVASVAAYAPRFFAELPEEEKQRIRMVESPHFFGYTGFGTEWTKGRVDQREQFDFGTECEERAGEGVVPAYKRLWGPSQWPEEGLLPGFRTTLASYIAQVSQLGDELMVLVAEALGLPADAFSKFTEERGNVHRGKIIKYPVGADSDQGVGPHFDGGFLTLLLQASEHRGLQVQNLGGEWIDAPPVPGTFVVNIGKALEAVTQGVAIATSHRVLSPASGARYSIPFFQMIAQDVVIGKSVLAMPVEMLALRDARGKVASDCEPSYHVLWRVLMKRAAVNYAEYGELAAGQVMLIGRIKSHPDVGQRHYPQLFHQLFPDGLPAHGSAY